MTLTCHNCFGIFEDSMSNLKYYSSQWQHKLIPNLGGDIAEQSCAHGLVIVAKLTSSLSTCNVFLTSKRSHFEKLGAWISLTRTESERLRKINIFRTRGVLRRGDTPTSHLVGLSSFTLVIPTIECSRRGSVLLRCEEICLSSYQ